MNIAFREARREDVPAIIALLRDDRFGAERETGTEADYFAAWERIEAEPSNTIVVGEADGRIVATFQLVFMSGLSHRGTRRAEVEAVRVSVGLRGRGIGRLMMEEAERRAREAGCRMLQLTTNAERNRARDFYESLGYTPSHVGFKRIL